MSKEVKYPKIVGEVTAQLKQGDEVAVAAFYAQLAQFAKEEGETTEFNANGAAMLQTRKVAKADRDIEDAKSELAAIIRKVNPANISNNADRATAAKAFWKEVKIAEDNVVTLESAKTALVDGYATEKKVSAAEKTRWESYSTMFTEE